MYQIRVDPFEDQIQLIEIVGRGRQDFQQVHHIMVARQLPQDANLTYNPLGILQLAARAIAPQVLDLLYRHHLSSCSHTRAAHTTKRTLANLWYSRRDVPCAHLSDRSPQTVMYQLHGTARDLPASKLYPCADIKSISHFRRMGSIANINGASCMIGLQ